MDRGSAAAGVRETHQRRQVLEILARGPIVDASGRAIEKLMAETGHETTNALSKVLRQMDRHGLIRREVRGRRTFRIELADHPAPPLTPHAAPGWTADVLLRQAKERRAEAKRLLEEARLLEQAAGLLAQLA